jgi:hypothetical protein
MTFDFDDFTDDNNRMDLFEKLRDLNPDFKCTVFAIPALCSEDFLLSLPPWLEIAVHGWAHSTTRECLAWSQGDIDNLFCNPKVRTCFRRVFKAPGWQISDSCYIWCLNRGIVVADQDYNKTRWPLGLHTYTYEGHSDRWHGHIQNVCGNGLEETYDTVAKLVEDGTEFEFVSEAATVVHRV